MRNIAHFIFALIALFAVSTATQSAKAQNFEVTQAQIENVQNVQIAQAPGFEYNKPGEIFTYFVLGYDHSLATDRVTAGGLEPAYYYSQLRDEAFTGKSGVRFYSKGCATIRIAKVVGISGMATVLGNGRYIGGSLKVDAVGSVEMRPGATFQLCGTGNGVALAGLSLPRSAWHGGPDVLLCFELMQPMRLVNATQFGENSPFKGKPNMMCSLRLPALLAGRDNSGKPNVWAGMPWVIK